jgi:hypothetical protein
MKQYNQFMVGDLVKYSNPEDNYREHICEINTVFSDGRLLLWEDDSEDYDDIIDTTVDNVSLIPISKHILNINGFSPIDIDGKLWVCHSEEFSITYDMFNGQIPVAKIKFFDDDIRYEYPYCRTVDELQRLMRMAGIYELADFENFKITE